MTNWRQTVADWWAERLEIEAKRERFRKVLLDKLAGIRNPENLRLTCDYDPWDILLDAVHDAGIECSGCLFSAEGILPMKTTMVGTEDRIMVSEGYGAPWEDIWSTAHLPPTQPKPQKDVE